MKNDKEPWNRKDFNEFILKKTYYYQKQFGFKIGTGEHATWNNEADAFKHAYMQAYLYIRFLPGVSKMLGDYHELETPNAPEGERNMDLWNNSIGREIACNLIKELGKDVEYYSKEELYDMAAQRIVKHLREGDLITNPNDPRRYI